jgi:hypothetical protein
MVVFDNVERRHSTHGGGRESANIECPSWENRVHDVVVGCVSPGIHDSVAHLEWVEVDVSCGGVTEDVVEQGHVESFLVHFVWAVFDVVWVSVGEVGPKLCLERAFSCLLGLSWPPETAGFPMTPMPVEAAAFSQYWALALFDCQPEEGLPKLVLGVSSNRSS